MGMDRGPERILDEYLVVMSQGGSQAAVAALVGRWSPRLQRYCARLLRAPDLAEDVTQEIWVAVLRGLPRLKDSARFPSWIYAIATRKCADALRARGRVRRLSDGMALDPTCGDPSGTLDRSPDDGLDLAAAIDRLPLDQRLTLTLHYGENLSVDEVAAVLRTPAGTVKSRLHHARAALKRLLEGEAK